MICPICGEAFISDEIAEELERLVLDARATLRVNPHPELVDIPTPGV